MCIGDIVYLPIKNAYVKYVIKKIFDKELIIVTIKTHTFNWLSKTDVLTCEQFNKVYNSETIYE